MDLFKKMINRKRPQIIGLCVENMEVLRLKRELEIAIEDLLRDGTISNPIDVVFVENDAPKAYMNSKQAMVSYPYSGSMKI